MTTNGNFLEEGYTFINMDDTPSELLQPPTTIDGSWSQAPVSLGEITGPGEEAVDISKFTLSMQWGDVIKYLGTRDDHKIVLVDEPQYWIYDDQKRLRLEHNNLYIDASGRLISMDQVVTPELVQKLDIEELPESAGIILSGVDRDGNLSLAKYGGTETDPDGVMYFSAENPTPFTLQSAMSENEETSEDKGFEETGQGAIDVAIEELQKALEMERAQLSICRQRCDKIKCNYVENIVFWMLIVVCAVLLILAIIFFAKKNKSI